MKAKETMSFDQIKDFDWLENKKETKELKSAYRKQAAKTGFARFFINFLPILFFGPLFHLAYWFVNAIVVAAKKAKENPAAGEKPKAVFYWDWSRVFEGINDKVLQLREVKKYLVASADVVDEEESQGSAITESGSEKDDESTQVSEASEEHKSSKTSSKSNSSKDKDTKAKDKTKSEEERLKIDEEKKAKLEAKRLRKEAKEAAQREKTERLKLEAEAARREEERLRLETEETARREQERLRLEAEETARREQERLRLEAEETARGEEERLRLETEKNAQLEEERTREEAEAKAKQAAAQPGFFSRFFGASDTPPAAEPELKAVDVNQDDKAEGIRPEDSGLGGELPPRPKTPESLKKVVMDDAVDTQAKEPDATVQPEEKPKAEENTGWGLVAAAKSWWYAKPTDPTPPSHPPQPPINDERTQNNSYNTIDKDLGGRDPNETVATQVVVEPLDAQGAIHLDIDGLVEAESYDEDLVGGEPKKKAPPVRIETVDTNAHSVNMV